METKKVIIRKKRGREFEYQEIEIPTDEAMIEIAHSLHAGHQPKAVEHPGWQVSYRPATSIQNLQYPSWNVMEGMTHGPAQLHEIPIEAECRFRGPDWSAIYVWRGGDGGSPTKVSTVGDILPGRPIVLQEDLFTWRRTEPQPLGDSRSEGLADLTVAGDLHEGALIRVQADRYERDPVARAACIQHYGPTCVICAFNFAAAYGDAAAGFIHVHHLRPLSAEGQDHAVDPIADLRPVCPNCHSFVHLRVPPISIDEAIGVVKDVLALRADNSDRD